MLESKDWSGSYGNPKWTLQHMLLPHEIVAAFLSEGETERMTGPDSWIVLHVTVIQKAQ